MTSRPRWSPTDIGDLSGRVAVITGPTSGIGLETARTLAAAGAEVVLGARNEVKAAAAANSIRSDVPDAALRTIVLDVSDLGSVESFATAVAADHDAIDILVNNAGIMLVPFDRTVDGHELHFGTNHLGHFALTGYLRELLESADAARVVTVSSLAHNAGEIDFDGLVDGTHDGYEPMAAYRRSKLANLLFAYELERRLRDADSTVTSLAAHPGLSNTQLASHLDERWWWSAVRPVVGVVIQSASKGSEPIVRAATDPQARGGQYYGPGGRNEMRGSPVLVESSRLSHDRSTAARLWDVSEELTGVSYP